MPVPVHEQAKIDKFFSEIAPFEAAYRYPTFRFVAFRHKGEWILSKGEISLDLTPREFLPFFETADIYAGEISLLQISSSVRDFLRSLLLGSIQCGKHSLKFPASHSGDHDANHFTFEGGKYSQDWAGKLTLNGSNSLYHISNDLEVTRQLKTSEAAFQSVPELAKHFHTTFDPSMNIHVDILAPRIAEITSNSDLALEQARIELWLAGTLDQELIRLALRGTSNLGNEQKLVVPQIAWRRDSAQDWICTLDVLVPDGKSVTCTLSYAGFVQQHRTISEHIALRDPLRFVFDQWDPASKVFSEVIDKIEIRGRDGRDLEDTVALMLSLAGFRVMAADRLPGLGEVAPDILAGDTRGNLLVIECTLKIPKADDKLGKLFRRYKAVRESLDRAGLSHIATSAVLAVALPRGDISLYADEAGKAGILLWGREDLHWLRKLAGTGTANEIFDSISAIGASVLTPYVETGSGVFDGNAL